jgi:hypothetical protein
MKQRLNSTEFNKFLLKILNYIGTSTYYKLITTLAIFKMRLMKSIATTYTFKSKDITTNEKGSLYFLNGKDQTVYLAKTKNCLVGYEVFLAKELDKYLNGVLDSKLY